MNKFQFLIILYISAMIFCISTFFPVNSQNGDDNFANFETNPENASTII